MNIRTLQKLIALALVVAPSSQALSQTTVAGLTPGSFRVTESGGAEYRIPIRIPPGIAGMEPKLALVYNSGAGNEGLGLGWTLGGLSFIHRCGRTLVQDGSKVGITYEQLMQRILNLGIRWQPESVA